MSKVIKIKIIEWKKERRRKLKNNQFILNMLNIWVICLKTLKL